MFQRNELSQQVSCVRSFFNVVPDRSRFTNPLMEVGQDVALISFCMCGLNAVDIFNAKKDQYNNGIFHYERQKTRSVRSDRGYFEVRVPPFLKQTLRSTSLRRLILHGYSIFMIACQHQIPFAQM